MGNDDDDGVTAEDGGRERLEQLRELASRQPDNAMVQYGLAEECRRVEAHEEAVEAYRRAIDAKPDYSAAYRGLGRALAALGDTDEAVDVFERGMSVAEEQGDIQTRKEMAVFLKRIRGG